MPQQAIPVQTAGTGMMQRARWVRIDDALCYAADHSRLL